MRQGSSSDVTLKIASAIRGDASRDASIARVRIRDLLVHEQSAESDTMNAPGRLGDAGSGAGGLWCPGAQPRERCYDQILGNPAWDVLH